MVCLRFDLDYVPWDSGTAEKYGHGEPAMTLKLLDFARQSGLKFHFFISNRALRTFPATADAILGEGHDLDWLTNDPESIKEAKKLFALAGHEILGVATSTPIRDEELLTDLQFITGPEGFQQGDVPYFPAISIEETPLNLRDVGELWTVASQGAIVAAYRPQVLAKVDPSLGRFKESLRLIHERAVPIRTLRDIVRQAEKG